MGKYIRKGKITGEVAVMEITDPSHSLLGVRTRARTKTLALQRLRDPPKPNPKPPSPPSAAGTASSSSSSKSSSCYLQLRSRRLEKCFVRKAPRGTNHRGGGARKGGGGAARLEEVEAEASLGENVVELEGKGSCRNSRETTPSSLIRKESDSIGTPGSTTRPTRTTANSQRIQNSTPRNIPTSREMEELFSEPEKQQQRAFAEKYNFDLVEDHPLPGRYEWFKLEK